MHADRRQACVAVRPVGRAVLRAGLLPLLALAFVLSVGAGRAEAKYASIVMNADSGEVLQETNADTRNYPASLTKMMTLYLTFEALDEDRISLDEPVRFSKRAAMQPASKLDVGAGKSIPVSTAIEAITIKSANDVASAMAEKLAGSERDFAQRMTAKARKLGMKNTTFRNASGLPHRAQMSTARDMAILGHALIRDFPHHYHYFSQTHFTHAGNIHRNTNKLLESYEGADGLKTGYIRASGFNLVTSAKRDGVRLIGVVFGGRTSNARNVHMARLLDDGWRISDGGTALASAEPAKKPKATAAKTRAVAETRAKPAGDAHDRDSWGIQVGAYKEYDPALEMAKKAALMVAANLADGHVTVAPLKKKNGRELYRARIVGIERRDAYQACRVLRKQQIGCMELRIRGADGDLAAAN